MVNIEISDDGAGIDPAAIRERALALGLLQSDRASRLGDRESLGLIFLPGLSTASRVTNVSGRGVGMDIVKANVEKIGGTVVKVASAWARRCIKIPLTQPSSSADVDAARQRYPIPQASLLEVVRLTGAGPTTRCSSCRARQSSSPRQAPAAYLDRELGIAAQRARSDSAVVVVLKADDQTFGLVVDEFRDTEEIVVKPLWQRLNGLAAYAGAAVMGDGRVALILDAMGLARGRRAGRERRRWSPPRRSARLAPGQELILLCRIDGDSAGDPAGEGGGSRSCPRSASSTSGRATSCITRGRSCRSFTWRTPGRGRGAAQRVFPASTRR
jgi:two-component system chemotaxis sensor kinase CheA